MRTGSIAALVAFSARWSALAIAVVWLVGCTGGGVLVTEGGIVGTGSAPITVGGTISAFEAGAIVVNGRKFSTTGASVRVNQQSASLGDLRIGMVVTVDGSLAANGDVTASSIDYRADLRGVVDGIDRVTRSFTLLGQTVRTDASAIIDGGTLDTLVSQYVEVSGFRTIPGEVLATLVQIRASVPAGTDVEVSGTVAAFNASARTFTIGTLLVDFAALPGAQVPAALGNGTLADVHGVLSPAGDRLSAQRIELIAANIPAPEGTQVELEGLITDFAGVGSFKVNGQVVDARTATITNGVAAALANDVRVNIEGRLVAGTVNATLVDIEQIPAIQVDGLVTAVNSTAGTFSLDTQAFATTAATQFEDRSVAAARDFGLATLAIGDHVVVTAVRTPALTATRVARLDRAAPPPSQPDTTVDGVISDYVSTAEFKVGGRKVNASSAQFIGGVASDLANGRRVEAVGTLSGDVLLASKVTFAAITPTPPPPATVTIEGTITGFVSLAAFQVAGQAVNASGAAISGGSASALGNGVRVEITGTLASGVLAAQTVRIESMPSTPVTEVEGRITAFTSLANFTIAGQPIDARNATISNGTAADIAVGRIAHAKGPVVNGVLVAATVQLEDDQEAEVEGRISNFVSVASFVVAGRQIDASSATFSNGTAAKLANGVQIGAKGPLVGTVMKATRVEFK